MLEADSLERLVPDAVEKGTTGVETLQLHLARYEFAARLLRGQRCLDIACGVGYGSHLIASAPVSDVSVVGVDVSGEAITYARERYLHEGLRFVVSDVLDFQDREGFDTVVSLETIEHLPDPERFVRHLVSLLRPGGILVASAPVTPSMDANPNHLSDFTSATLRRLFAGKGLREVDQLVQVQPYSAGGVLTRGEARMKGLRTGLMRYYVAHPQKLVSRMLTTVRYGFTNRYLTVALERT